MHILTALPPPPGPAQHADVIFVSDVDPFGGYFSGWQTLLVYNLTLAVTIVALRRKGTKFGRLAFYLGLFSLVALQIMPYLILLPKMRIYGVTLALQAPQMLAQSLQVAGFWLPVYWLTASQGQLRQNILTALGVSVVHALLFCVTYKLAQFPGDFDFDVLNLAMASAVVSAILFAMHIVYLLVSSAISRHLKPA